MKQIFLFILGILVLSNFVLAEEITSVYYKLDVEYKPNCQSIITNLTTNETTTITNVTYCYGMIEIFGIENNHLTIIENFSNVGWKKTFSGVKIADMGNESDISGIMDRLESYNKLYSDLNRCMDSNRNVSTQLILLEEDRGFKNNFTECSSDKKILQNDFKSHTNKISSQEIEIEGLKSSKTMFLILGFIAGALGIKYGLPAIQGRSTPKDESESQFPQTGGY